MSEHTSGFEKKGTNIKKLTFISIGVVLVIVLASVFINKFFLGEKEKIVYEDVLKPEKTITLKELHAKEDLILTSYQLIDTAKGIYSIPIDSAIELYIKETNEKSK